jgi:hypothetical protein
MPNQRGSNENGAAPTPEAAAKRDVVLESIKRALEGIDYGSILIKVHQGEVVSIETSVKQRLTG